jgi:hypothetical protein
MDSAAQQPANATIRASAVQRQHDVGIFVAAATATLEGVLVEETAPRALDGGFGDGIAVFSVMLLPVPGTVVVSASRIAGNARAGISSFGGHLELGTTRLDCNLIDLDGEDNEGSAASFMDLGKNGCGCGDASTGCQVLTSGLTPPDGLTGP